MAEHHFIVKYDDETKTWSHDVDSEEVRFPDGTIWNESLGTWDYSYQGEGKFFPHLQRGTMVGGPNDKKRRSVHGLAAPLSGAWGAASGRRELTTSRESSASGKIRRQVRAKRRARRRPPSLRPRVIA